MRAVPTWRSKHAYVAVWLDGGKKNAQFITTDIHLLYPLKRNKTGKQIFRLDDEDEKEANLGRKDKVHCPRCVKPSANQRGVRKE